MTRQYNYTKKTGRPTLYDEVETIERTKEYIDGGYQLDDKEVIPTIVGLAIWLGVTSTTCYQWAKEKPKFSDMLRVLMDAQGQICLQGGMTGRFNPTITKLVLSKHGYSDRVEQVIDNISSDGSMKPAVFQGVSKNPATGFLGDKTDHRLIAKQKRLEVEYEDVTDARQSDDKNDKQSYDKQSTDSKQSTAFKQSEYKRGRPAASGVSGVEDGALSRRRKHRNV